MKDARRIPPARRLKQTKWRRPTVLKSVTRLLLRRNPTLIRNSIDSEAEEQFMRFGRNMMESADKRFMRFGRGFTDSEADKRFMRFCRDPNMEDKRFMPSVYIKRPWQTA
ncbi:hypothetical protein DPMN_009187 [Dreissena polymorpha]|uniref:Uncharacterized protein n=1 Tax=Dreissena polymorpha TaxID=45954 RepID=A0A9D4RZU3_DREPO|nr:hypothetical protein DPMN_009187 [Dreissena polymorpha]